MDHKVQCHSFASDAIKRKFLKNYRKPRLFTNGLNTLSTTHSDNRDESASKINPWMGLFDDPALHEALDRIMASNRIA